MQTEKITSKTAPASTSAEPCNLYRGTNKAGVHKLEIGGCLFDGYGKVHRQKSEQVSKGVPIKLAGGVPKNGIALQCVSAKTGNFFLFAGTVQAKNKMGHIEQRRPATATTTSRSSASKHPRALIQKKTAFESKVEGKNQTVTKEIQRIREAKEAGLDLNVRMEFVEHFLDISRATIYRWMDTSQFPKPIKHGHVNFWPLSVIEQFASGQWTAQFTQTSHPVSE